jgi:DmsE family decaheme c-type cytochrome
VVNLKLVALLLLGLTVVGLPASAQDDVEEWGGYIGDETCLACHEELQPAYDRTIHAKVLSEQNARSALMRRGCEACHGPAEKHAEAEGGYQIEFKGALKALAQENATCLACHQDTKRLYWEGGPHDAVDVACTSCHIVMKNVSEQHQLTKRTETETCAQCHLIKRSRLFRNAHMPARPGEEKMSCSSCHNPHGTISEALIPEVSVNDACYACHAEKRGPFLWEHPIANESCLNCHDPHGSTRDAMLKLSLPRLCQQCHVATLHPSEPRAPNDRFVLGRSCLNCHTNIHGSNHPSGFAFTR